MDVLLLLARALIVGWLPGAALFRAPLLDRARRAALTAEERCYWSVMLSAVVSLSMVLALAAAHRYSFSRLLIADAGFAIAVALASRFNLRLGPGAPRPGVAAVIPIALVLFASFRFSPPSEYVMGGKDPGVYINEGVLIGQRGALVATDPVVAAVPSFARPLFMPTDRAPEDFLAPRFMGFYVVDPDRGRVVGQFPHLFPASIAIGYGLAGLTGARYAVVFWAVLGILSVYFAAIRLLGLLTAAAAAVLLALNVISVWFGHYPNAEVVMQALLFAAILANARGHVDDDPFFAPVAGALLGLLLFLRFDAVVAVGAVAAALALGFAAGQRVRVSFVLTLATAAALATWYYAGLMHAYIELPIYYIINMKGWHFAVLGLAAAILAGILVAGRRSPAMSSRIRAWVPLVLSIAVLVLAAYAFWLRQPGGKLTSYDAHALRTFAEFYLTVPALIAAVAGYILVTRSLFWRDPALIVTFTAFAVFFFYKIRIWPEHFWMARRFVPIILPGTLLFVSAVALTGVRGRVLLTRAIRGPIGLIFLALLAVQYARGAKPIVEHVEYAGIIARLEALAGRIHDDDLLVVESRDAGSDVHVLATPLAYIYARNVLVLASAVPDKTTFAMFLEEARHRYRRVLFLGGGGTDLLSSRWTVTPVASERFQVPEYAAPREAYPRFVNQKEFDYSVYLFGPASSAPPVRDLDVGINDDLNVVRFHAKETANGRTMRWSRGQSFVILDRVEPGDRTVALWMHDGGRPAAAPPADVTLLLGNRPLGSVHVSGSGFREYDVAIPPDAASALATGEPVRLTLRVPTWNPHALLGAADERELGVMVDRVALR